MALPASDTFTNTNGTLLSAHGSWSLVSAAGKTSEIQGNAYTVTSGLTFGDFSCYRWNADTFNDNQYSKCTMTALDGNSAIGVTARCASGANSYYWLIGDTGGLYKGVVVAGTSSDISSYTASSVNDVVEIRVSGTTIGAWRNGSSLGDNTDSNLSSGYAGVITQWFTGQTSRGDSWEGGNLAAGDTIISPTFIAAGAQTVTLTIGATLAPALPAGWAVGDLLVMIIAGRCNGSTITNTFSNTWSLAGSRFREIGTGATDLWIGVYTRIAQPGEASPTVTPDADFLTSSTTGGVSAQIGGFRYASSTLDVAAAVNDAAAAATWTPPAVTTVNPYSLVISCVATSDDNALDFGGSGAANSFTLAMSGASYDTTTGSDHAVGMAYLVKTTAGAVTMCIWNESAVGNDPWVGVTVAFTVGIHHWTSGLFMNQALIRSNI